MLKAEGKYTEPAYFRAFARTLNKVIIDIQGGVGVPYTVAQKAVAVTQERRDSFESRDEVWAIFDRDEHPRFAEAVDLCKKHKVGVAQSNPCFEVWLILHVEEYNKPNKAKEVQAHLKKLLPEYDPAASKSVDCAALVGQVEVAEQRGARLLARRAEEGSPFGEPSTNVGHLTASIRKADVDG